MKSVGEVMAIGSHFQESLQKALRGLEIGVNGLDEKIILDVNSESYKFDLIKTENLTILSSDPTGRVFVSNPRLSVKTSNGAENGLSICGYSTSKDTAISNIPLFINTNSTEHNQQLRDLKKGNYNYYVTCIDRAGNIAKKQVQFEVATTGTTNNVISFVYKDSKSNLLTIGTNEDSDCQYDNKPFSFGSGIPMTDANNKKHEANLPNTYYYVSCRDIFNNEETITVYT